MRRKWKPLDFVMLLFFFIGIGILAYPYVSRNISAIIDQQYINYYQNQANQKNQVQMAKLQKEQEKKNRELTQRGNTPGTDTFTKAVESEKAVKKDKDYFEQHTIGVLTIPKINVKLPIFDQTNDVLLQKGATLLNGTSIPVGGPSTHSVLSAHRGLPEATLFDRLPELKLKDHFFIKINKQIHAYEVDQIKVIEPTNTADLLITKDKDYVTLMTCTPYMVNTQRLLVRGHRVPYTPQLKNEQAKQNKQNRRVFLLILIASGIIIFLVGYLIYRKVRKKRE